MKKIYLDYAASTPVDPEVLRAMEPYFAERFGNPGSVHSFGQEAIAALDRSRETIAKVLGAEFREVVFTSSATEANNLALRGVVGRFCELRHGGVRDEAHNAVPHIIVSAVEHESVLTTARDLERDGVKVTYIPVDARGIVDLKKIKESLTPTTALVSVMYANNEIGTVEPIVEVANVIKEFREGEPRREKPSRVRQPREGSAKPCIFPLFHTDAAQALQFLDCDAQKLGVDLMTISSHKIYGPKGAGALFVKERTVAKERDTDSADRWIAPILAGGGQEFGLRSGTENVPAIVGFAKAAERAIALREKESMRLAALHDRLWEGIKEIFPGAEMNGGARDRLPNILNVYFPGCEAQDLLTKFDLNGLAASSGSACRSRAILTSYVIEALGYDNARARSSIRFSVGRPTAREEIDAALAIMKSAR